MTDDFEFDIRPEDATIPVAEAKVVELAEPKWIIHPFGGDNPVQLFLPNRPGLIRRFWMWAFFGWKFEPIQELGPMFEEEGE